MAETTWIHRKAIWSMLEGVAANDTSRFQSAKENNQTGNSIEKTMIRPFKGRYQTGIVCYAKPIQGFRVYRYENFACTWKSLPEVR